MVLSDGRFSTVSTVQFGTVEPQMLFDYDFSLPEVQQQLVETCLATMPQTGWEAPVLSLVDLVRRNKTHRQQAEQEVCQQRTDFEHQMGEADERLQLASNIQRDQRQELQRMSALVASREGASKGREAALQQELAEAKQQIAELQQETASSALQHKADREAAARLARELAAAQKRMGEQAQQAQEVVQAVQALSYEALNLCASRHTDQLQAMTARLAKQTEESSLVAASAAADRQAAAGDAQEAAGRIRALQSEAQAHSAELLQSRQSLRALQAQKLQADALQVVICWQQGQARQAEMCQQAHMHAASRQAASLRQEATAHHTSRASMPQPRTEPWPAVTFSQALQAEPCRNAAPASCATQAKAVKASAVGRPVLRCVCTHSSNLRLVDSIACGRQTMQLYSVYTYILFT